VIPLVHYKGRAARVLTAKRENARRLERDGKKDAMLYVEIGSLK